MPSQSRFDWLDYLSLAETLRSASDTLRLPEACMRSSASRAYYAAFHMAMEKAQQEGYSPAGSGDDHRQVQKHFQEAKNGREEQRRARRKIGTELDRLRDLRNKADYDNSLDRQADSLAAHALGMAKRIVDLIQAL